MSIIVDMTYIGMIGQRLEGFRQVKRDLFNFRCPICGDSHRNKTKRRGYFYPSPDESGYNFCCHNCGASHKLYTFIELLFPEYLKTYRLESFIADGKPSKDNVGEIAIPSKPVIVDETDDVIDCTDLPDSHPAIQYLLNERKLPRSLLNRFQYVERYVEWINEVTHADDETRCKLPEHPRILIPYHSKNGFVYKYNARVFDKKRSFGPKYLYTILDVGSPFYNLPFIDPTRKVYIFEGHIDSMLIDNSIAIGNAKYSNASFTDFHDYVLVTDNQPRNPEVVKSIGKAIDLGMPVCLFSDNNTKDVNDMLISGLTVDEIKSIIDKNTYKGLRAKLQFSKWRKV